MKLADVKVLVTSDNYWGKGDTVDEALAKIKAESGRQPRKYVVYLAHPDTKVDGMGDFTFPAGPDDNHYLYRPREIHRVGIAKG